MGAAELTESLGLQAIDDIPVGLYVPLLEFNQGRVRPASLPYTPSKTPGSVIVVTKEVILSLSALVACAKPLIQDCALIAPALLEVALLVDLLEGHARHLGEMVSRIAVIFAAHPRAALFAALPGAGAVLAPRLLVAFGDNLERYPDAQSLQKYAGLAPVLEKSGRQSWTHWRWAAPKFLRQSFVEWAGQTVATCTWAHAYYVQQRRAGKVHHAVLRALAFKWIHILWRCWHDQIPYDEQRFLAALRRQGSPLAASLLIT